jgi:hypothetical protein
MVSMGSDPLDLAWLTKLSASPSATALVEPILSKYQSEARFDAFSCQLYAANATP